MHLDAALNLAWLCLATAILAFSVYQPTRSGAARRSLTWLQLVGVLAIAGTLFPYVSATDDLVWMDSNGARTEHQGSRGDSGSGSRGLIGLFQTADASVVASAFRLGCTFVVIAFLSTFFFNAVSYQREHVMGRSPPAQIFF